jgi:integrase
MVPMLHVENARTGFVEPADFDALLAALPTHLQAPTRFAYVSAWRRGEVLGLTWARVTFDADGGASIRLDAAQSKNGSGRVLPFVAGSPLALLLAEQHEAVARFGVPRERNDTSTIMAQGVLAIGQPNCFHDLSVRSPHMVLGSAARR